MSGVLRFEGGAAPPPRVAHAASRKGVTPTYGAIVRVGLPPELPHGGSDDNEETAAAAPAAPAAGTAPPPAISYPILAGNHARHDPKEGAPTTTYPLAALPRLGMQVDDDARTVSARTFVSFASSLEHESQTKPKDRLAKLLREAECSAKLVEEMYDLSLCNMINRVADYLEKGSTPPTQLKSLSAKIEWLEKNFFPEVYGASNDVSPATDGSVDHPAQVPVPPVPVDSPASSSRCAIM